MNWVNDTGLRKTKLQNNQRPSTKLVINGSGVEVVLEDNNSETKLCALAAGIGASHATQLAMVKQESGLVVAGSANGCLHGNSITKAKA